MKVCQEAGSTRRSRLKQISKWERDSAFRVRPVVEEKLHLCLCVPGSPSLVRLPCGCTTIDSVEQKRRAGNNVERAFLSHMFVSG